MKQQKKFKCVHEGRYVAEVEVQLLEDKTGWSPYLSVEDAYKLDDVRCALRQGDLESAAKHGRVYELRPVVVIKIAAQQNQHEGAHRGGCRVFLVHTVIGTPANVNDVAQARDLLHGKQRRVCRCGTDRKAQGAHGA